MTIRWYVLTGHEPPTQIIHAPDKASAQARAGGAVISVCEYDVMESDRRTAARARQHDLAAIERAIRVEYALAQLRTSQGEMFAPETPTTVDQDIKAMTWARGELYAQLTSELLP